MAKPEMISVEVYLGFAAEPFFRCDVSPNFRMNTVLALARDACASPPEWCTLEHHTENRSRDRRIGTGTVDEWRELVGTRSIAVRMVSDKCMHGAPPGECGRCD